MKPIKILLSLSLIALGTIALGQEKTTTPQKLPGKGLKQHDFLYTGEWEYRKSVQTIYVIRDGKAKWTYDIPFKNEQGEMEELGDATMRENGNIVFCRKTGASEISPDKKIIWNVEASKGTEIHAVQAIGKDRVMYVINGGSKATGKIVDVKSGKTVKEFTLPTGKPKAHLQFRRVRVLESGNVLAAHLDSNVVAEYDADGKTVWSFKCRSPWSAVRLKNGNTLISSFHNTIYEVDKNSKVVWELNQSDIPEVKMFIAQGAERLPNGNTVIANWCGADVKNSKDWPGTVQLIEVTPDKKLAWALSEWNEPDLGPASSFQLLNKKMLNKIPAYK